MAFNPQNKVWSEKYRPKKVDALVGDFKDSIKNHIKNPMAIPNFLFYSKTPGTGKSSLSKAIINDLDCDYIVINSSDERKIETIRGKVKQFAISKSSKEGKKRCVFMDEFDGMCLPFDTKIICGTLENPIIRKIQDIDDKYFRHNIPSVNIKTKKLENDKGKLIKSGIADFYEIELEDGKKIKASKNHPFFNNNFEEIKVIDLKPGMHIVDYSDEIYHKCVCGKNIFHNRTACSIKCKNKLHSQRQSGTGNSRYGAVLSSKTKALISKGNKGLIEPEWKRKAQSKFMKENNPMNSEESRKRVSIANKGKIVSDETRKKLSEIKFLGLGTKKYEEFCIKNNLEINNLKHSQLKLKKTEYTNCDICNKIIKTKNKNSGAIIHHKNKNRKINIDKNLSVICSRCHNHIHLGYKYRTHKKWLENYMNKIQEHNIILYGEHK